MRIGKKLEEVPALRANRRSFDCASCDETARGSAQDDNLYLYRSIKLKLYVDTPWQQWQRRLGCVMALHLIHRKCAMGAPGK
jgi:hypothetical protein